MTHCSGALSMKSDTASAAATFWLSCTICCRSIRLRPSCIWYWTISSSTSPIASRLSANATPTGSSSCFCRLTAPRKTVFSESGVPSKLGQRQPSLPFQTTHGKSRQNWAAPFPSAPSAGLCRMNPTLLHYFCGSIYTDQHSLKY